MGKPFKRGQEPGDIVIAYSTWRKYFNSDPDIIGKQIMAEGRPMQVMGVAEEDFDFPENPPGYWYLMNLGRYYDSVRGYYGFVKLRHGCTGKQFQNELTALSQKLGLDKATNKPSILVARPILEFVAGNMRPTMVILFGATTTLLLIACINVTNLLLSRSISNSREMALREALGARRWRVIRQIIALIVNRGIVLAAMGIIAGAIGAAALRGVIASQLYGVSALDVAVFVISCAALFCVALLAGFLPAQRATKVHPADLLRSE